MDTLRIQKILTTGFIAVFGSILLMALYWQISTPAEGDSGFLNYFAWLITQHEYTPYRDLFDTSFPMALLFHMAATWMGNATETGFQLTNISVLLIVSGLGYRILSRIDRQAAWITIIIFGLFYEWQDIALARDFQCLLWVLCSMNILITTSWKIEKRVIIGSVFFSLAVATKPHSIFSVFPLIWYVWQQESPGMPAALRLITLSITTGIVTACLPFLWLWYSGGWPAFVDIFTGYLPLYMELSGNIHVVTSDERALHLLTGWFDLIKYILPLMAVSLFLFFRSNPDIHAKRVAIMLAAEAIAFSLYVVIAGKFWLYQQTPYLFFAISVITIAFAFPLRTISGVSVTLITASMIVYGCFSMTQFIFEKQNKPHSSKQIYDYLSGKQADSSTVVQLWQYNTDGARGLWLAGVKPATAHITYEAFYHHVSHPYTQRIRSEFVQKLHDTMPDIIIRERYLFIPAGSDSTNQFEAFDQFIAEHYVIDKQTDYYTFYLRKT